MSLGVSMRESQRWLETEISYLITVGSLMWTFLEGWKVGAGGYLGEVSQWGYFPMSYISSWLLSLDLLISVSCLPQRSCTQAPTAMMLCLVISLETWRPVAVDEFSETVSKNTVPPVCHFCPVFWNSNNTATASRTDTMLTHTWICTDHHCQNFVKKRPSVPKVNIQIDLFSLAFH